MQFFYHKDAGNHQLKIDSELHKYIFKVRRHNIEESLNFRNLDDLDIYTYEVESTNRRETTLKLVDSFERKVEPKKYLHIGWCVIDPKNIEKQIASLNELGVSKITFIYCKYSQAKYKINKEKLMKILQNSSGQCGRSSIIEIEEINSLEEFLKIYPDSYMFNFSKNHIVDKKSEIETIVIGCEGGFSKDEVAMFDEQKIVSINSDLILQSQTAATLVSSFLIN